MEEGEERGEEGERGWERRKREGRGRGRGERSSMFVCGDAVR